MTSAKVIPPGGEGSIDVTFKTGKYSGKKSKSISVTTNDPKHERLSVSISANVVVDFMLQPPSIYMGRFSKTETIMREATILAKEPEKVKILKIEPSSDKISAKVKTMDDFQDDQKTGLKSNMVLEITLAPGMKTGRFHETVKLTSNIEKAPEYILNISGEVLGDIIVEPRMINFRRGEGDEDDVEGKSLKISTSSADKTFSITKVESTEPSFKTELKTVQKGKEYEVLVSMVENPPEKFIRGDVLITTDDPENPELKVPVYASFRKAQERTDEQGKMTDKERKEQIDIRSTSSQRPLPIVTK
ncbi:DUF1573 domain-containing protein [bacterium]|nr:DUF1573 domain-containing protein [candidate division CSSED10-310 bacterium]